MYARVHTLSTTSTHKSSRAVMDPSKYQSPYTAWILGLYLDVQIVVINRGPLVIVYVTDIFKYQGTQLLSI